MLPELPQDYRLPDDDEALLDECDMTLFMASGPGGQHRNRTMSAVRLKHRPSGLIVIGRRERSQHRNRAAALARLRGRLVELLTPRKPRRATRPSRRAKKRRVDDKKRRSGVKRLRGRVRRDDD
jgi:protein subunit release factor A